MALRQGKTIPHAAAVKAATPSSLEPMLPSLVQKPFSDPGWLFEPKWDGWRTICFFREGKARLISRKQNSLTERFDNLAFLRRARFFDKEHIHMWRSDVKLAIAKWGRLPLL